MWIATEGGGAPAFFTFIKKNISNLREFPLKATICGHRMLFEAFRMD
jgi:hypothetical protein